MALSKPNDEEKAAARAALRAQREDARSRLLARLDEHSSCDRHHKRLSKCGEEIRLRCQCCHNVRVAHVRCDLKWCPSCAPRLAFRRGETDPLTPRRPSRF